MILVCGGLADPIVELVCARLLDCGYPYRLLDLGLYPAGYKVCWEWRHATPIGYIAAEDWRLDVGEIHGVFSRYPGPDWRTSAAVDPPEFASAVYAECDAGLTALLEHLPCVVANRLEGGMSNNSKPYQALLIRDSGLLIPPTLVTNDPDEARQFIESFNEEVVYKSISGVRSIVRLIGPEQLRRLSMLENGPAQLQRFIPGDNIRVHTVGKRLFATRVHSETVDYRYASLDGRTVAMEVTKLEPAAEAACLRLASALDLAISGIDLKETPDGDLYCFEVNPCPAFLYYEQGGGQAISGALADLLQHGERANA